MLLYRTSGNTIAEYLLVGAMVLVVAIAALGLLGVNISNVLADVGGSTAGANSPFGILKPVHGPNGGPPNHADNAAEQNMVTTSGETSPASLTLNGKEIALPPAPDATTVNTAGGNGNEKTLAFSNTLSILASQLAEEDVDPGLVDMVSQLANSGHELASSENQLEQFCPAGKVCGQTSDLGFNQLSEQKYQDTHSLLNNINNNKGNFQQKLEQLNNYLNARPGAYPPELRTYVEQQAQNILAIAENYKGKDKHSVQKRGGGARMTNTRVMLEEEPNVTTSVTWGTASTPAGGSTQSQGHSNNVCSSGGQNCHRHGFNSWGNNGGNNNATGGG